MKNQYRASGKQWCLVALWVMSFVISVRAQTMQPPVIQWQRVVEATNPITVDDFHSSRPTIVKNSRGGYSVVTGDRRLLLLTSAGNTVTDTLLTGVSANGETITSLSTAGLAPTSDGGVVVGVLDSIGWSLQRRDASGALVWTYRLLPGPINQSYRLICVVASPDGGFVSFGVGSRQIQGGNSTSTIAQKLDKDGVPVWNTSIRFSDRLNSFVRQAISTTDGGYLMVGNVFDILNTASFGWAARLDEQGSIIWQKGYAERGVLRGVVLNPYFSGSFIASATDNSTGDVSQTLNIGPNGDLSTGYSQPGPAPVINSESRIVAGAARNGAPAFHTMLDAVNQNNSDFRLTNLSLSDQLVWTKTLGGSGNDVPQDIITTNDGGYVVVGTTTSTDGDVQGRSGNSVATWIVKLSPAAPFNALTLTQPTYNCLTGAITFNITGGDGSPITYTAPGITRANVTDNFGTVEQELRNDPKPITITAIQSGRSLSFTFDFGAYCAAQPPANPPVTNSLALTVPEYDCGSGAFTFRSSGGDGSPIEYMAIGITAWTTNPNQFVDRESRTANDVKPFTLMARQNGQTVTYTWDLKAACGRANSRLQATQTDNPLTLTVLGNPVQEQLRVRVQGSNGQPVLLQLTDLTGRSIESRTLFQADVEQEQVFELRQQGAGLLLLRASNGTQQRTVKVVKQ